MSEQIYAGTAQYNLIYIFSIDDDAHRGYLKIGEHSFSSPSSYRQLPDNCDELNQNAHNRIRQYTRTAPTRYELLHTELARKQIRLSDGTIESSSFSDHDVHEVLDRSGYDVRKFYDTDRDSEWYKVTLKPAIAAIKAVKANRNVLTEAEKAGEKPPADRVAETGVTYGAKPKIILREEQQACIDKTKRVFNRGDRMLWDCKMRFGKTITAYSLVKNMGYKKVLVVTHRPAVVDGWRTDFSLIFQDDHVFLAKANIKEKDRFTAADASIDAENDRMLKNLADAGTPFVYFASMQDFRGSKIAGGKFDKNIGVFSMDWDLITSGGTLFERNWNDQGITYILKNEKYSGDLLLQKYYTVDFLTKKVAPNNGQLPQYFVENSHEPVIPREIFQQVQAEMARRRKHWQEFKYYHSNVLSSKVVCGNCGLPYRQVKTTWRCDSKMNKSRHPDVECRNDSIRDDRLRQIIVDAFNALPERRDELVRLEERLRWGGLDKADEVLTRMETAMDSLEEEIREAQEAGNTDEEENARKQLAEVREKWAAASEQRAVYADKALHIRGLQDRVRAIAEGSEERPYRESPNGRCAKPGLFFRLTRPGYADGRVTECSDDDILRFIEKIEIGWQTVTVTFTAGISVELPREA